MGNRLRTDGTLFAKRLIERSVQGGQPETSSVKIDSKEEIGRTSGSCCCNRQFQKDKGWESRLKGRIELPVVITVVWHQRKPSGDLKVDGNFLNGKFPFVFYETPYSFQSINLSDFTRQDSGNEK